MESLRRVGVQVAPDQIDEEGRTHPRLTTLPLGFAPAPGVVQCGHECILYGSAGKVPEEAKMLPPLLDPKARWSGQRVPEFGSPKAATPHALVIDDLVMLREVPL